MLAQRLAIRAREQGYNQAKGQFEERAQEVAEAAAVLRRFVENSRS